MLDMEQTSQEPTFREEVTKLVNKHSWDTRLNMSDTVIASYINSCLFGLLRVVESNGTNA